MGQQAALAAILLRERAVPPSCRTGSPKDLGTKILVPIVNLVEKLVVNTLRKAEDLMPRDITSS